MKKQLISSSILTLLCGGLIYMLFRSTTLKMFSWYEIIGLGGITNFLRANTFQYSNQIPEWVLFSLPDGLWIFSYVSLMFAIWQNSVSNKNILYAYVYKY